MAMVLVVEDNEVNRIGLTRRLERRGYGVIVAEDGPGGVSRARADAPHVILLDMNLPLMDGWDVARALKADPATQAIPIIALTAHAMSGDRDKCLAAGCDDYHTKPVDFTRLLMQIETVLGRGAAQTPAHASD